MSNYAGHLTSLQPQYEEKGRAEATAHRPPSTAIAPDQNEVDLRLAAESHLNTQQARADAENVEAVRAYAQLKQKIVDFEFRAKQLLDEGSAQAVVAATLAEHRHELVAACTMKLRAQVAWRAFREKHRISEDARYPESRILHFAWVAVFALIETAVNAFFFENSQGLLGGFIVALGVSVLNIGTAAALGIGFRYKNLEGSFERPLGWLCLGAFLLLTVFFNALFAAFRSEYQLLADPNDVFLLRNAFSSAIAEAPRIFLLDMHMADFMSFILFGIGLILSGFAFWKGYTSDDRHPGYSRLDQARLQAEQTEGQLRAAALNRVKELLNTRRHEVSSAVAEPGRIASQISSLESTLAAAIALLEQGSASIQRDYELVLGTYRQANTAVRATPAPEYFRVIENLASRVRRQPLETTLNQAKEIREALDAVHAKFQPSLRSRLEMLNEEAASVVTSTYEEFLCAVDAESWRALDGDTMRPLRPVGA